MRAYRQTVHTTGIVCKGVLIFYIRFFESPANNSRAFCFSSRLTTLSTKKHDIRRSKHHRFVTLEQNRQIFNAAKKFKTNSYRMYIFHANLRRPVNSIE